MSESKVTKENMLFHLKHGCGLYPVCPICNAIRALIEHGPEVSSKQIEDICIILLACDWPRQKYVLEEWLIAKGVTVKEGK